MSAPGVWIGVALIGGLGGLARFRLDGAVARRMRGQLPLGTLTVNVIGALGAGVVYGAGVSGGPQTLLAVGALGGFTTFSTWMLETQRLAEDGRTAIAGLNLVAGASAGLAAAVVGWGIGSLL